MKKVVRITAYIFLSLFIFITISCKLTTCNEGDFVQRSVLKKSDLLDLIKPSHTEEFEQASLGAVYFNSNSIQFNEYGHELYDFLVGKKYKYFGYQGAEISSLFGANGTYEFYHSSDILDHYHETDKKIEYEFIFGNEIFEESKKIKSDVIVRLTYNKTSKYENGYNTILEVRNNTNLMTSFMVIPRDIKILNLSDAYDLGLVSKEELNKIANYLSGIENPNYTDFDQAHDLKIKYTYLEELIKEVDYANIDRINITHYIKKGSSYIVCVTNAYTDYPDVIKEIIIDGVSIKYSGVLPVYIEIID